MGAGQGDILFATCVQMFQDAHFDPFYLENGLRYEVNTSDCYCQQQSLLNCRKERKTVQLLPTVGVYYTYDI